MFRLLIDNLVIKSKPSWSGLSDSAASVTPPNQTFRKQYSIQNTKCINEDIAIKTRITKNTIEVWDLHRLKIVFQRDFHIQYLLLPLEDRRKKKAELVSTQRLLYFNIFRKFIYFFYFSKQKKCVGKAYHTYFSMNKLSISIEWADLSYDQQYYDGTYANIIQVTYTGIFKNVLTFSR